MHILLKLTSKVLKRINIIAKERYKTVLAFHTFLASTCALAGTKLQE